MAEIRLWEDLPRIAPKAGEPTYVLPFDRSLKPISDLESRVQESWFCGAPEDVRLVLDQSQVVELADRAGVIGSDRVVQIEEQGVAWQMGRCDGPEAQFWTWLFGFLAGIADPRSLIAFSAEGWGVSALNESHAAWFEADILRLETRGLHVVSLGSSEAPWLRALDVPSLEDLPTVSVVMPVYNSEPFLLEAIESVLGQSFRDLELICIDDGSDDGSLGLLKQAASRDGRIRVYTQANAGVASARNRGLELARGRYISFADADDKLYPDSLKRRVACLEGRAGEMICGGRAAFLDEQARDLGMHYGRLGRAWFQQSTAVPFHITTLMGRSHIMRRQRFPDGVAHAEDWAYIVGLLSDGWSIASCGEAPLVGYRWHGGSATAVNRDAHFEGCLSFLGSLSDWTPEPRLTIERPAQALDLPPQRLARALAQRLQAHFLAVVLAGDTAGLDALLKRSDFRWVPRRPRWLTRDFFDVAAVRVFRLPRHSSDLDRSVTAQLDFAFDACRRLPREEGHRALSIAFRRYLLSVAGRTKDRRAGPAIMMRKLGVEWDAALLSSLKVVRFCQRLVAGKHKNADRS